MLRKLQANEVYKLNVKEIENVQLRQYLNSKVLVLCFLIPLIASCDSVPSHANLTWTEPVVLASGDMVRVRRRVEMWQERAFGGNFSSAPIYRTSTLELASDESRFPLWNAPMVPVVIDKDPESGEWVIVATGSGCDIWLRNGRPRPPYWAFQLHEGNWYRSRIPVSFLGRPANLFVGFEVRDQSRELSAQIEERKRRQAESTAFPRHYKKIEVEYDEFDKGCSREPSEPVGFNEMDLEKFRSLQ